MSKPKTKHQRILRNIEHKISYLPLQRDPDAKGKPFVDGWLVRVYKGDEKMPTHEWKGTVIETSTKGDFAYARLTCTKAGTSKNNVVPDDSVTVVIGPQGAPNPDSTTGVEATVYGE